MAQPSSPGEPNTVVLTIESLQPEDVTILVASLSSRAPDTPTTLVCELRDLSDADLRTVDALARLALGVRRLGLAMRLRDPSAELRELLDLAGLCDVVPCASGSGLEVVRQAEQREEPLGVQEEGDPADPSVS